MRALARYNPRPEIPPAPKALWCNRTVLGTQKPHQIKVLGGCWKNFLMGLVSAYSPWTIKPWSWKTVGQNPNSVTGFRAYRSTRCKLGPTTEGK
jgi:hypothetical protein